MNYRILLALSGVWAVWVSFGVETVDTRAELRRQFADPPREYALRTFFHWGGDGVSKEGLAADLTAMAEAEISAAYICAPAMMPRPKGLGAQLLSPEWFDIFEFAVREAKARGITFAHHNCPGWSASGGPWITPENSMKIVTISEKDVTPGAAAGKLPQPMTFRDFYRDIAVMALAVEPTPAATATVCEGSNGAGFAEGKKPLLLPFATASETPVTVTRTFARPFRPTAVTFRFVNPNVNCEGVVEGSSDGVTWTKLGHFCYHFHFAVSRAAKMRELNAARPVDRIRIVFRANAVPEWQGGKPKNLELDSVAFSTAPMFADADAKSSALASISYNIPPNPAQKGVAKADWLTLSEKLAADGTLNWTAPARQDGKVWRVLRFGYTTSGKTCAPSTLSGLECDKLSKKGLDAHWPNMPARLLAARGAKDVLKILYIDSWEASGQNWTENFADEFRTRRGYDLAAFLPVYAGYRVDDAGTTAKALYDIQRTVADLIAENYYGHYRELCCQAGVEASIQAYGGPFDNLRCLTIADAPQGEFWLGGDEYGWSLRAAASAAHLAGRPTATAESFTTNEAEGRWQITPHELRQAGDRAWLEGINRFVYHSYVHQPFNAKPGLSLGRHGTQLNRNTTWWPEMRHWSRYVRRGQFLLSAGSPSAELLSVNDEGARPIPRELKVTELGYHYDSASAFDFRRMQCRAGGVGVAGGATYPAVFLAGNRYTLATLRQVKALAADGAHIAGPRPIESPTLGDDSAEWKRLVDELWGAGGKVLAESDPAKALAAFGIKPSVVATKRLGSLRRVLKDGTEVYFLVNLDRKVPFDGPVAFAAKGCGEIWNAVDASVTAFDGKLSLPPSGSAFVIFPSDAAHAQAKVEPVGGGIDLSTGWKIVSFDGQDAPAAPLNLTTLIDWSASDDPKLRYFAGRAVYEKTVKPAQLNDLARVGETVFLDLGDVRELANVYLDGKFVACLWESPYRVALPRSAFSRPNERVVLRVEVVNTWPNRLIGDAVVRKNGVKEPKGELGWPKWVLENKTESGTGIFTWSNFGWAWKAESPLRPAGLLGPVKLLP